MIDWYTTYQLISVTEVKRIRRHLCYRTHRAKLYFMRLPNDSSCFVRFQNTYSADNFAVLARGEYRNIFRECYDGVLSWIITAVILSYF